MVVLLTVGVAVFVSQSKARAAREKDFVAYEVLHQSLIQKCFRLQVNENKLKRRLVGTWEMAATKSWGATNFTYVPKNNGRLKIFTMTDWSVVHYDSDSNLVVEASGPYTLQGNVYTETIASATGGMTKYLGARPRFKIQVEGDKYYQMGVNNNPPIEEMWQRVP
jgi:hypothetical protein